MMLVTNGSTSSKRSVSHQKLATEHSFNISFMRRIENEEFNRIRNTLLTLYKDKKCPVNKYFYYCRTEPSKEYAASKLFDDFPLELNEKILLWSYGDKYILEVEVNYFIEFMKLLKVWEIDAINMDILLAFPKNYEWLIVFGDDELEYKILEFLPLRTEEQY